MNQSQKKTQQNTYVPADNIDEQGNVLYLDEDRLARKDMFFPVTRHLLQALESSTF